MKTEYENIKFEQVSDIKWVGYKKEKEILCLKRLLRLNAWCLWQVVGYMVLTASDLRDIADFLDQLNEGE